MARSSKCHSFLGFVFVKFTYAKVFLCFAARPGTDEEHQLKFGQFRLKQQVFMVVVGKHVSHFRVLWFSG